MQIGVIRRFDSGDITDLIALDARNSSDPRKINRHRRQPTALVISQAGHDLLDPSSRRLRAWAGSPA
jgi:hypothetical protein